MSNDVKFTFKVIEDNAALDTAIKSIATRGAKWEKDVQRAAISAMWHHKKHGDTGFINRLIEAMPKSARKNALLAYIETHGGVIWDTEAKQMKHVKGKAFKHAEADAVMWTAFKPDPEYKPIVAVDAVKRLIGQMEKDMKEVGDASTVTPEMLAGLRALTVTEPAH